MNDKKAISFLLSFCLLVSLLMGSMTAAYGLEGNAGSYEENAKCRMELRLDGTEPEGGFLPGETLRLQAYVASDSPDFAVQQAGATIRFDSGRFELTKYKAETGVTFNGNAGTAGGKQSMILVYQNTAPAAKQELPLLEFELRVKDAARQGSSELTLSDVGVSESGQSVETLAKGLSIQVGSIGSCQFQLIPREMKDVYIRGDSITYDFVVSSSFNLSPRMISEEIVFDSNALEFVTGSALSAQSTVGWPNVRDDSKIVWIWNVTGQKPTYLGRVITMGAMTFRVKEQAHSGEIRINQMDSNLSVYKDGTIVEITDITAPDAIIPLEKEYGIQLKEREERSFWKPGEVLTLDLQVVRNRTEDAVRMLDQDILFNSKVFELVTCSGITGSIISADYTYEGESALQKQQRIKILYSSQFGAQEQGDIFKVAAVTLRVKEDAAAGVYELLPQLQGMSVNAGNATDRVMASSAYIRVDTEAVYTLTAVPSDRQMGTVTGEGSYHKGESVAIAATANPGCRFVGWSSSGGGTFADKSAAETTFIMPSNAVTVTAVFAALSDPAVTPVQADYDLNGSGGLMFTVDPGTYEFSGIQGQTQTTDYTVNGTEVTLLHGALEKLGVGSHTLVFQFSGEKTAAVTVNVTDRTPEPEVYELTVAVNSDSMGTVTGGGSYAAGDRVTVAATAKSGYRFIRWEAPAGVSIDDAAAASTVLKMPAQAIQVTALFAPEDSRIYEALLKVENEQASYRPGDRIELTVQAKAADENPYGIRMLETNVKVDASVFDVTSAAGIGGAVVTAAAVEGGGTEAGVQICYRDESAAETAMAATDLAKIVLTVKEDARPGSAGLTQSVTGFTDARGDDVTESVLATGKDFVIGNTAQGVTVSGSVTLTSGDVSKVTVVLTKNTIDGAAAAYAYPANAANGDYEVSVNADGTYTIEGVAAETYTLLIRKPGALYYQRNGLEIGRDDLNLSELVTLPVGDLDRNGVINALDLNTLVGSDTFGKAPEDAEYSWADLDDNDIINALDLNTLVSSDNFGKSAVVIPQQQMNGK